MVGVTSFSMVGGISKTGGITPSSIQDYSHHFPTQPYSQQKNTSPDVDTGETEAEDILVTDSPGDKNSKNHDG